MQCPFRGHAGRVQWAGADPAAILERMRLPPTSTADPVPSSGDSGYILALLVLLASLMVVGWYWHTARERGMESAQADFVAAAEQTSTLLYQRLGYYELVTRGGVALFGTVA